MKKWHSPNPDVFALISDAPQSSAAPLGKPKEKEVESIAKRCEVSLPDVFAAGGCCSWRSVWPWSFVWPFGVKNEQRSQKILRADRPAKTRRNSLSHENFLSFKKN